MRKLKAIAFSVAAAVTLVAAPAAYVAADQGNAQVGQDQLYSAANVVNCARQSAANGAGQDIFLSSPDWETYYGSTTLGWQNVKCTNTTFRLAYRQRALIVANFNAEADCNGPANQWCKTRALLDGVQGTPVDTEANGSFAFDSANGGSNNWQAHSMVRGWERTCQSTAGCQYRFQVQTQLRDTSSSIWLDEIAAHIHVTIGNPAPL